MLKIGLLTFHGSHNYGSVLQSFAMVKVLESLGYEVQIINLRNEEQLKTYRIFSGRYKTVGDVIRFLFTCILYPRLKRRYDKYEEFINHVLPITRKEYRSGKELMAEHLDYDIYMTGSDQVWNPACQDFESAYYLDFADRKALRIAYAPSLGKNSFGQEELRLIQSLLKNIDYISCREQDGVNILKSLTDKLVAHVCDPVVLLGREGWEKMLAEPDLDKPYILTYFLNNNHGDRSLTDYFRKKTGYKVIALNEYIRDFFEPVRMACDRSPAEFVGLFRYASLIYTNSFHGTVFATLFNRPFYTAVAANPNASNNNDSRKIDYLSRLGLQDRIVGNKHRLPDMKEINYTEANVRMEMFREYSLAYLTKALQSK